MRGLVLWLREPFLRFQVASVLRLRTTQSAQLRSTRVRNSSAKLLVLLATWRVSA